MVPTLTATLGVKGRRPVVGSWDCKHLLYVLAVLNVVTAAVHATTVESRRDAARKTGKSKNRRLQEGFAAHLRHVGRLYPRDESHASSRSTTLPATSVSRKSRPWKRYVSRK